MADTPDGSENLEDKLTSDLQATDEDSSLLDTALGDVTDEQDNLLDESVDGEGESEHLEEDTEIEAIKARVKEMEEEAEKLKEMQGEVEKIAAKDTPTFPTPEEKKEADARSVHIGNVDYQSTAEELGAHFNSCGSINRVTILCDKYTGQPKGFAFVEFAELESVLKAVELDESLFKGRQIKVSEKRTNKPGISSTNRGGYGRGRARGRGRGMNPYYGGGGGGGGYMMMPMQPMYYRPSRGRAYRGRTRTWHAPY